MMAMNSRLCQHLLAYRPSSLVHNKLCLHRRLSRVIHVSASQKEAVKLSYNVHHGNPIDRPVVILHGLLGSGKNFDGIAKQLVRFTGRKVVTVDARNHGDSEHSDKMGYEDMSLDIVNMLSDIKAKSCTLIGHSLGGRTAMTLALTKDDSIRDFMLTNLVQKNGQTMWRVNVDAMLKYFRKLGSIPDGKPPFTRGPVLFIGGSLSDYITEKDHPNIYRHFPKAYIKTIEGATHWVHYDKPQELIRLLAQFISGHQ